MVNKKITLSVKAGKLAIESESVELPTWLVDILRQHKDELISLLLPENEPDGSVEQRLKQLWVTLTRHEPQHDTSFFAIAFSSLDVIKLRQKIINEFKLDIPLNALYKAKVFIDQVNYIERELAQQDIEK
jgi:acyl carrier protein